MTNVSPLRPEPPPVHELGERNPRTGLLPWRSQARVLKALIIRDLMTQFAETRLGFLLRIILPVVALGVLFAAMNLRGRLAPAGLPLVVFLFTGWPLWQMFRDCFQKVMRASDRQDGLLMFPGVTVLDIVLAGFILEMAANTAVMVVVILVVSIFWQTPPADPVGVIMLYWSCGFIGGMLGLAMSPLQRIAPVVVMFMNTFMRFGMWISGVIFTMSHIPSQFWPYLTWNPILHAVEGTRQLWWPNYESPVYDPGYIALIAFMITAIGLIMERGSRRYMGD